MKWEEVHRQLAKWSSATDALTTSQRSALAGIVGAMETGVPYIDLFGKPGVGKTFLARHLVSAGHCIYLSSPASQVPVNVAGRCVLIDNVGGGRHEVRWVCNEALAKGARTAVIITPERVHDSFLVFELKLTPDDEAFVYERVARRLPVLSTQKKAGGAGLWALVVSCTESDSK